MSNPNCSKRHMYCNTLRVYREMTSHTLEVRKTAIRGNTVFCIQQQSHLESVIITGIYSGGRDRRHLPSSTIYLSSKFDFSHPERESWKRNEKFLLIYNSSRLDLDEVKAKSFKLMNNLAWLGSQLSAENILWNI